MPKKEIIKTDTLRLLRLDKDEAVVRARLQLAQEVNNDALILSHKMGEVMAACRSRLQEIEQAKYNILHGD